MGDQVSRIILPFVKTRNVFVNISNQLVGKVKFLFGWILRRDEWNDTNIWDDNSKWND